ncbi:MAG TPA: hypothetical protein VK175_15805 [Leadbetterella sp.]|nr:hypothetical protein [Leadbetterella sp.]
MTKLVKILIFIVSFCKFSTGFTQEIFTQNYDRDILEIKVGEKKVIFYNIIGTNRDFKNLKVEIALPDGFRLLTNTPEIASLKMGEHKRLFFTIQADANTKFGQYPLDLNLTESEYLVASYGLQVNLARNQKIEITPIDKPDKLSQRNQEEVSFLVKNAGNSVEELELSSRSGLVIGSNKMTLEPGQSRIVKTRNDIPTNNQEIRLTSFDLLVAVKGLEKPFVSVFTVPIMSFATTKNDPYQRFPIQASVLWNQFNSGVENIGAFSFDVSGKGFVDSKNKHLVEFIAKGPNNFNIPRFGNINQYFVAYQTGSWRAEIGDKMFSISELTDNARFAKGLDISRKFVNKEVSVFFLKPRFIKTISEEFGATYTQKFTEQFKATALYMHKNHEEFLQWRSSNFLSLKSEFARGHYKARGEASLSTSKTKVSSGFFYNSSLELPKLKVFTNAIYTGKNYFGFYNNSILFNNSAFYNLSKKTTIGYSNNLSQLNPSLDEFVYTVSPYFFSNNLSLGHDINKRSKLRFNLISGQREDKMEVKTYHYKERLFRYFYDFRNTKWNVRIDGDLGKTLNLLEAKDQQKFSDVYRYRGLVVYSPKRNLGVSVFLEHLNTSRFSSQINQSKFWFYGVNANLNIRNSLNLNVNYRNNFTPDELYQSQSFLDASINYRFGNQEISLMANYGYIPPPINDRNVFATIKYTIHLNTPIRKKKGLGSVAGKMQGVKAAGVLLNLNGKQVLTDADGRFAFHDLVPGKYYLGAAKSTLGFGNIIDSDMPYLVEIAENENKTVSLNVINTGKVLGKVDLKTSDKDGLENILVEIYNDKFTKVTTTNTHGEFQFSELQEGDYQVRIISENIKKQYVIKNPDFRVVVIKGEESTFTFNMEEKKKKVNFQKEKIILTDI